MRKIYLALLLAMLLLLCGCEEAELPPTTVTVPATVPSEPQVIATVPANGTPGDVTCLGSYTAQPDDTVVASVEGVQLTNRELQVWYWAQVAQYRQENHPVAPDFSLPLDTQPCPIDGSVNSWQQYFLRRALAAWHTTQALLLHSENVPIPLEADYKPNEKRHAAYMTGQPGTNFLYGYKEYYQNTLHQKYLESLDETLNQLALDKGCADLAALAEDAFGASPEALTAFADSYNRAYMYFTTLSYSIEPDAAISSDVPGKTVDIRHLLLIPDDLVAAPDEEAAESEEPTEPIILEKVQLGPDGRVSCSEDAWAACEAQAQELLAQWEKTTSRSPASFAELANKHSDDTGTALDGGGYQQVRPGQLLGVLDQWCFDDARVPGDTVILRSEYGVHILYFCAGRENTETQSLEDSLRQQLTALVTDARQMYPTEIDYESIRLGQGSGTVSPSDVLYPDIGHERFPEIPLYLQQDYPSTRYGYVMLATHGCGITTMAMLASYMADEEYTPPEMCAAFGRYASNQGTDGNLFIDEPAGMGFYLRESTLDANAAYAALEEGQIVISLQRKGYWTRGGHFIALERLSEDGRVQVRDSNLFNYNTIRAHREDLHDWSSIIRNDSRYWIYEDKVVTIPACSRCGTGEELDRRILLEDYICRKCTVALRRRDTFLVSSVQ